MADQPSPPHGRTPWDVLHELSRRRSFLVLSCLVGWGLLVAVSLAWYHDVLPKRGASKANGQETSQYLHWSFEQTPATREQCSAAALRVQTSAGASPTEMHDREPAEAVMVGVHGPIVSAVGCAGFGGSPQSLVIVAAPDQSSAQNKEVMLRKLLDSELPRKQ